MGNLSPKEVHDIRRLLGLALDLVRLGLHGEDRTRERIALTGLHEVVQKCFRTLDKEARP